MSNATTRYTLNATRGFTLIELLVVLGVLSLLTSLLLLYSRVSERQLVLFREQSKLVSAILRAKSLSVQTFKAAEEDSVCGYGVHFSTNAYRIFKDPKIAGSCATSNKKWDGTTEDVEVVDLSDTGVTLATAPFISDVFFTPPNPNVLLSSGLDNPSESIITLSIIAGDQESTLNITINNAGQVSTN